jgi:CBS domain-containing protein
LKLLPVSSLPAPRSWRWGWQPDEEVDEMKVEQVMTPLVVSVNADADVAAAAQLMRTNNVGFLPVRRDRRLVGIITDRDIAVRAAAHRFDVGRTEVAEVMTPNVVTVKEACGTDEALRIMEGQGVSRLVVVDDQDKLVGVVSLRYTPQTPIP